MLVRFALLIMVLNEIDGLKEILPQINKSWVDELLVVDGGSTDGSIEFVESQGVSLIHQKEKGFRHAYLEALDTVSSDYVIPFSPDGNSVPENIVKLRKKAEEGYDMVTCSRYLAGATSHDDDLVTAFGNWFLTAMINLLHRGSYTDSMVMYRAIHRDIFYKLELHHEQGYAIPEKLFQTKICLMPLLSIRAARHGLRITEIPGDEPPRIGGERKLKILKWGLSYAFQIVFEAFYRHEKKFNPCGPTNT